MTEFESQSSLRKALPPLLAMGLIVPLARLTQACQDGRALAASASAEGVRGRPPLLGGIVASDDVANREALDTQPYLGATPLGYQLELEPGDALHTYAWDGAGPIAPGTHTESLWIPFGELGSDSLTTLYCSFNKSEQPEQSSFALESKDVSIVAGRTRAALRLESGDSYVRYQGESSVVGAPLTVELWWLPDAGLPKRASTVVRVPGFFRIWVDDKAHVFVDFDGEERTRARPEGKLRAGEWNRISLAVDPEMERARLVLNDSVRTLRLAPPQRHGSARDVYLGKGLEGQGITGLVDDFRIQGIALDSAEMVDRYLLEATPGEHRLQLELSSGSREVGVWAGIHSEPELSGRAAFARGALEFFDPTESGLQSTRATWSRDMPANRPVARTTQPVIYVGDSEAFLFSGETKDSYLPGMINTLDTWIYHIDEMRWERTSGPGPPGRCHQSAAYSPHHDVVLMVGGWVNSSNSEHTLLGDTWLFHVDERRWEQRKPSGWKIGSASDSGVVYNSKARKFYLFQWNSVLVYDPEEDSWTRRVGYASLDAEGEPTPEYKIPGSPICEYDPDRNKALIFGGVRFHKDADNEYIDHTAVYDFETHTFTTLDPENAPSPRTRGALAYDTKRKRFVLFGGVQDQHSDRQRDLWIFDMDTSEWEEMQDALPPSRRGGYYKMAYDPELDLFSLLCGRASPKRFLNEAWRLRIDDEAVARATYVFDRSGFAERDHLVLDVGSVEPEQVRLELESSQDAVHWQVGAAADLAARFLKVTIASASAAERTTIKNLCFTSEPAPAGEASITVQLKAAH